MAKNRINPETLLNLKASIHDFELPFLNFNIWNNKLKINSEKIADVLLKLGQIDFLKDMKSLDPDRMDFYQESIESISE